MKRQLSFFRVEHNGKRWYATCCAYGPFTNPEAAIAKAEEYNRTASKARKQENKRAVEYWKTRRIQ